MSTTQRYRVSLSIEVLDDAGNNVPIKGGLLTTVVRTSLNSKGLQDKVYALSHSIGDTLMDELEQTAKECLPETVAFDSAMHTLAAKPYARLYYKRKL